MASGLSVDDTVDLYCGQGEQVLQWVGYASCSRLAYKRGEGRVQYSMHGGPWRPGRKVFP